MPTAVAFFSLPIRSRTVIGGEPPDELRFLSDGVTRRVVLRRCIEPPPCTFGFLPTLAERVGFPRAVRAVASACGANPVPLAIACHRVVSKDGSLGGFSLGGLDVKEKLLKVEAQKPSIATAAA